MDWVQIATIGSFVCSIIMVFFMVLAFMIQHWSKLQVWSKMSNLKIIAIILILTVVNFGFSSASFYFSHYANNDKKYLESKNHLIPIIDKVFRNEKVLLDGHSYRHNKFYNVRFVFRNYLKTKEKGKIAVTDRMERDKYGKKEADADIVGSTR